MNYSKFNFKLPMLFILMLIIGTGSALSQQKKVADRIIAVINDRIILKSDVDSEVRQYMQQARASNQEVTFTEDLWFSALQSMIDSNVMLEQAEIDSVIVSDEMVNRAMDNRINQMIQQAGSEEALERALGNSIVQIRAEFRDEFREQMTTQQLQQQKMSSVEITRPEVKDFFSQIPENQLPTIPEQVELSQIVITPPELEDARDEALRKAESIRDSIVVHGKNFEEMARKYSDGPSASRGGLLPLMPLGDLVANYSAAASALDPGEISQVVRTDFGYHVIRLNKRQGDNIETNHILIQVDEAGVDEDFAINMLEALKDSVNSHGASFRDLAREYSEDETTSSMGGRIMNMQTGERKMALSELEPSLYRIALLLDESGEISDPRPFTLPQNQKRAYRIVRLDAHYPEHIANLDDDYNRIREIALQRKQMRVMNTWLEELRDKIYVDIRIDIPESADDDGLMMQEQEAVPVGEE